MIPAEFSSKETFQQEFVKRFIDKITKTKDLSSGRATQVGPVAESFSSVMSLISPFSAPTTILDTTSLDSGVSTIIKAKVSIATEALKLMAALAVDASKSSNRNIATNTIDALKIGRIKNLKPILESIMSEIAYEISNIWEDQITNNPESAAQDAVNRSFDYVTNIEKTSISDPIAFRNNLIKGVLKGNSEQKSWFWTEENSFANALPFYPEEGLYYEDLGEAHFLEERFYEGNGHLAEDLGIRAPIKILLEDGTFALEDKESMTSHTHQHQFQTIEVDTNDIQEYLDYINRIYVNGSLPTDERNPEGVYPASAKESLNNYISRRELFRTNNPSKSQEELENYHPNNIPEITSIYRPKISNEELPDLSGGNFSGSTFFNLSLKGKTIKYANFNKAKLFSCTLSDATLYKVDMDEITMDMSFLDNTTINSSKLRSAKLRFCDMNGLKMDSAITPWEEKSNMRGADISYSSLKESEFYFSNDPSRIITTGCKDSEIEHWDGIREQSERQYNEILRQFQVARQAESSPTTSNSSTLEDETIEIEEIIYVAASTGDIERIRRLISEGANIDTSRPNKISPICKAIKHGDVEAVEILCSLGADVNSITPHGEYPIHWAAATGHVGMIKKLAQWGANVNSLSQEEATPTHIAAGFGNCEAIRELYSLEANIDLPAKNKETPLFTAARYGRSEAITLLHELGADVNTEQQGIMLPVNIAAMEGHTKAILALNQAGADINSSLVSGITTTHLAAMQKQSEVIKLLHTLGENIDIPDSNGLTPVQLAELEGHREIVQLFRQLEIDDITHRENSTRSETIQASSNSPTDPNRPSSTIRSPDANQIDDGLIYNFYNISEEKLNKLRDLGAKNVRCDLETNLTSFQIKSELLTRTVRESLEIDRVRIQKTSDTSRDSILSAIAGVKIEPQEEKELVTFPYKSSEDQINRRNQIDQIIRIEQRINRSSDNNDRNH